MSSPFQGAEIPGMASMNDPLGFVKKLWGDMHLPGMVTPTVSVDELDKKIKDLKTVESWLNVNMNMLRGTIQALEVQRATISTLKSMGESFAQQMNTASTSTGYAAASEAAKSNAAWPMPTQEAEPAKAAAKEAEPAEPVAKAKTAKAETADKSETNAPFANPAAWWGLLQDQFKQAVNTAMENDPTVAASKAKPAAAAAPAKAPAKASAKTPAKPTVKATVNAAAKKNGAAAKPAKAPSKRATPK
ncbi:MAG: PhaM family polyhydroxyalkanoate granule multifunctional regulatory protein [Pseudomonadota bacterium]